MLTLSHETRDALLSWAAFFTDTISEEGGPLTMAASFASDAGPWSLICTAAGCKVVPPAGQGKAQALDEFLEAVA